MVDSRHEFVLGDNPLNKGEGKHPLNNSNNILLLKRSPARPLLRAVIYHTLQGLFYSPCNTNQVKSNSNNRGGGISPMPSLFSYKLSEVINNGRYSSN
jgi:hypothetical protein